MILIWSGHAGQTSIFFSGNQGQMEQTKVKKTESETSSVVSRRVCWGIKLKYVFHWRSLPREYWNCPIRLAPVFYDGFLNNTSNIIQAKRAVWAHRRLMETLTLKQSLFGTSQFTVWIFNSPPPPPTKNSWGVRGGSVRYSSRPK